MLIWFDERILSSNTSLKYTDSNSKTLLSKNRYPKPPRYCVKSFTSAKMCDDGIAWFQSKGKWKSRGYSPAPGTLIFFDWNGDGTSDHVGIVEKTEGSTVYTVEGNSSDAVNQRSYDINNGTIMGYGIL